MKIYLLMLSCITTYMMASDVPQPTESNTQITITHLDCEQITYAQLAALQYETALEINKKAWQQENILPSKRKKDKDYALSVYMGDDKDL